MFHDGLDSMEKYFGNVKKNPSIYDGQKVREMIDTFGTIFTTHLSDEIGTLEPENLRAIYPEVKDLKKTWMEMMDWAIANATKMTMLPWV